MSILAAKAAGFDSRSVCFKRRLPELSLQESVLEASGSVATTSDQWWPGGGKRKSPSCQAVSVSGLRNRRQLGEDAALTRRVDEIGGNMVRDPPWATEAERLQGGSSTSEGS